MAKLTKTLKRRIVNLVENKIINIFLKIVCLLILIINAFFLSWSGLHFSLETLFALMLVIPLFSLLVISEEYYRTKKGLQTIIFISVVGVVGLLIDTYRVYRIPEYIFDIFSLLLFITTLIVFISFILISFKTYKKFLGTE